eukprot:TRINITY_DN256_c0_g1_i1.p1 TRINITY_DN256_c0_g1~~TRINITY_DN256_c0_g1_i1.p1  ORF type:complete len:221 (+),score=61.60 TRINITY_DN256_c0_g1_i1:466-1128(+)
MTIIATIPPISFQLVGKEEVQTTKETTDILSVPCIELAELDSEDLYAAFMLSHFRQYCENCKTEETPQWRKGWHNPMLGRSVLLCNACGLKYHKNQFCSFCHFIYGKEQEKLIGTDHYDEWLSCRSCSRWCHTKCENEHGIPDSNLKPEQYSCLGCRTGGTQGMADSKSNHPKSLKRSHHQSSTHSHSYHSEHLSPSLISSNLKANLLEKRRKLSIELVN